MPLAGPHRIDEIVAALRAGEVCAIPTDTVYGLAASLDHPAAVRRLAELKGRAAEQPIAVLFDAIDDIASHVEDPALLERVRRFWPGGLTAIVRVHVGFAPPPALSIASTVGLRQPDDALARSVLRACGGALAVTSANRHGEPPATSAAGVAAIFGAGMLVLDGGPRPGGVASTVVDLTVEPPVVVRAGAVSAAELGLTEERA